ELGGMYHGSGAQYSILRDAYGPFLAFLYVFCQATAILAGGIGIIAGICVVHVGVAGRGSPPSDVALLALAPLIIALLPGATIPRVRLGSRIQTVTVIAKVAGLVAVIALAALAAPRAEDAPAAVAAPRSPFVAVLAALVPAFFSYGGWQGGLAIAG